MSKQSDNQICEVCGKRYKDHSMLRCTPASEMELHKIARSRETGKVQKPSWYVPPKLPAPVKYDMSQAFPARVRAMFTKQSDPFREAPIGWQTAEEYIMIYDRIQGLKQTPIEWVKTEGNFA